jgi:uncharacterized protein YbjT (DUF2867 family)
VRIVVLGGSGALGALVVAEAAGRGHTVVAASRRTGVDVSTGEGLAEAVAQADAVVHTATSPLHHRVVDIGGTQRLAEAVAARPEPPHLVYVSIVGCDANPFPYYRSKAEAEEVLEGSGAPATVVRATQFHSLAAFMARTFTLGPLALAVGRMAVQPVDPAWVASRLVDVAEGPHARGLTRAPELAGPEVLPLPEVAALVRQHEGRSRPRVLRVPALGGTLRAFSRGTNLPGPGAEIGGVTFAHWLADQPRTLTGR